ncbi:GAF domain-containing protein [Gordonia sp. VNK1]|uniref:GAF domain-containing protein n=1 Tax=Gordonia oleivorans TaxID=3156618 RepID=UPI0032B48397
MSFELSTDAEWTYDELESAATTLVAGEHDRIANAANISSLIYHSVPRLNWVGFYLFDGTELVVGPFQGKPACVRIPLDRGVCGAAARTRRTQRVADVHAVSDHIACDAESRSELVVPLVADDGTLIGVFDVDSPDADRFSDDDQQGLEAVAAVYVRSLQADRRKPWTAAR